MPIYLQPSIQNRFLRTRKPLWSPLGISLDPEADTEVWPQIVGLYRQL